MLIDGILTGGGGRHRFRHGSLLVGRHRRFDEPQGRTVVGQRRVEPEHGGFLVGAEVVGLKVGKGRWGRQFGGMLSQ